MKTINTFKLLLTAALIGGCFVASAMEEQFKRLKIDSDQEKLGKQLCSAAEAGNLEELNRLIEAGAEVDYKDQNGWTALIQAADNNHLACVRTLLNAQADPNIQTNEVKQTALMRAAYKGSSEILDLLINAQANLDLQDIEGDTALMFTCENSKVLGLLIDAQANLEIPGKNGWTALIHAVRLDDPKAVELLIKANANLDTQDEYGDTALMHAYGKPRCLSLLIDAKANLKLKNQIGWTALMHAVINGYPECVQLLMAAGADIHAQDNRGKDTLTNAFIYMNLRDTTQCMNLLIDAGADLRPTVQQFRNFRNSGLKPLIMRSINVFQKRKKEAHGILWCIKQFAQDAICDKDLGLLVAERLLAAYCNHKEMLSEAIELLPNENDKIKLKKELDNL